MKITKESIYLIFIFVFLLFPFIAIPWGYDGFEYPKFLVTALFGSLCGFILLISNNEKMKVPSKEFLLYFSLFIISVIFSNNFLYSFFGDYPRLNQNLILYLSLFLVALFYINFLEKTNIFQLIFYSSVILGVSIFFENHERVYSTLGQPNFLGIIFVLGIIYSFEKFKDSKFYLLSSLFLLFALVKTASITSIFALIIGISYYFWNEGRKYYKYFLPILATLILIIFFHPLTSTKIHDAYNLFVQNKETKISDSLLVRIHIWEDSIKIPFTSLKNFLIGIGPENFSLFYETYRGNKINFTSEWASLIDKPHNYFLEIFIEQGIFGLFSFLYLLYVVIKRNKEDRKYLIPIIIFLFFNWAFLYLQLILFLIIAKKDKNQNEINLPKISIITLSVFLAIINFLPLFKYEELDANIDYYKSKNPEVKLNGLNFYYNQEELPNYIQNIKESYPNNLKMWFEIYKVEKAKNYPNSFSTKEKIKYMRNDLTEWNEVFK